MNYFSAYQHLYENEADNESFYYYGNDESEQWRIDELDREKSEKVLKNYRECLETGTFLIRRSEGDKNSLTLCIL